MFPSGMSFLTTKKGITFRCIWKAAKNCWSRKVSTLLPKCEENLCVTSTVDLTFIALITQRFCSHFGTNVESLRLHFVLHPATSGIRRCYFLLVCLFWLQRRWWHFVAHYSPRNKFVSQWKNEPVIYIDDISSHPSPSSPLWCVFSDYQTMLTQCLCQCCSSFFATCPYCMALIEEVRPSTS